MSSTKQRKVALCINQWGSEESIYAWKWIKHHLLKGHNASHIDHLYIVHVIKGKEKERWDLGGPVVADVRTAVASIQCTIKELEGDAGTAIVDFAAKENIDVVIICSRSRGAVPRLMLGSVTETVVHKVQCAVLVIRPQMAAGDTMRLKAMEASGAGSFMGASAASAPPAVSAKAPSSPMLLRNMSMPAFHRRVAIAYDATVLGKYLLTWTQQHVANPDDAIYVVRNVPKTRKAQNLDRQSVQRLAQETLAGHRQVFSFSLQGNSKATIPGFVENEGIDLLVLGAYKEKAKREVFGTRQAAMQLYRRCNCPVLIVPLKQQLVQQISKEVAEELGSESTSEDEAIEEGQEGQGGTSPGRAAVVRHGRRRSAGSESAELSLSPMQRGSSISTDMRGQLAAQLQEMSLPAGTYLVEVGETGQVRNVRLFQAAKPSHTQGAGAAATSPPAASPPTSAAPTPLAAAAASAPTSGPTSAEASPKAGAAEEAAAAAAGAAAAAAPAAAEAKEAEGPGRS